MKQEGTILSIVNRFLASKKLQKSIPSSFFNDLADKIIKIRIDDISYNVYVKVSKSNIVLSESSEEYDVEIKSSLANYLLFIISRGSSLYSSKIIINGDVDTASKFNSILSDSESIKDLIANLIGNKRFVFLEKMYVLVSDNVGIFTSDMENSIRDYVVYDLDLIPSKKEIAAYLNEVDDLSSRTEKLLQKFKK